VPKLLTKIARALAGDDWPSKDSASGSIEFSENNFFDDWDATATLRTNIYKEMDEIDETVPEGSRALSVLADNAVNARDGSAASFRVLYNGAYVGKAKQKLIEEMLERTELREKIGEYVRSTLKYGDGFEQIVVSDLMRIERIMSMPVDTMRRNEDEKGVLEKVAFTQYEPGTTKVVAQFSRWQIYHLRWNHEPDSKYGRGQLYAARGAWKKMVAMEEAFVINRLTRAFARLLFTVDTTGMTEEQGRLRCQKVMNDLRKRNDVPGDNASSQMTVVKDIVIGKKKNALGGKYEEDLTDVKVLDTSSTADWSVDPLKYYRNKFLSQTGVPKSHLGLEEDINAKATLQWQDERFVRTVRRVQMMVSEFVVRLIKIEFALNGIDVKNVDIDIEWQSPSTTDMVDRAAAFQNSAVAFEKMAPFFNPAGLKEFAAWYMREQLGMPETQAIAMTQYIGGVNVNNNAET
jgi:hypothetical protein